MGSPAGREEGIQRIETDVVVIGGGASGRAARAAAERDGRSVALLDAAVGDEVVAVYAGPTVVARTATGMVQVHAAEIVVATGAAELHPVCPGNGLAGLVTARAAELLHAAGVDLGETVAVGTPPDGVPATSLQGRVVRFEGGPDGRVRAVVVADDAGIETTTPCETVVLNLGRAPRDLLARMAGDVPLAIVGSAAGDFPLPAPPTEGCICPCSGTTVDDLSVAWDKGFTELELLKRASLACLGTCQGSACLPQVRAWIAARSGIVPDPFTARPAARQITFAEAAADVSVDAFRRTPLHDEHLALGARMDRFGGWWRPWHYGDAVVEYWAVREAVSLGDVSTLGKLVVSGPDVVEFLERLYPCHVADIKPGRSRYALLLNERGHVMDDGMILRESETRFVLSFTSGGAANAEMWVRDWIDTWGLRVHVLDRTMSLAAINVTGPLARTLLARAGLTDPPRFLGHVHADVAGIPCHVMRLSFTGETAFELHHPIDGSVELWRALTELGGDLGIRPHGLQALFGLRLEKGHVIVGMDTELDTTPRRIGMDWAVRMEKPRFIGRAALERTAKLEDHRRWMGFTMEGAAPYRGIADLGRRRHRRQRHRQLDVAAARQRPGPWLAATIAVPRASRDRWPRGGRRADPVLRPGGPPCPSLSRCTACALSPTRRHSIVRPGRATETSRSFDSPLTTSSRSARGASRSMTRTRSSSPSPGSSGPGSRPRNSRRGSCRGSSGRCPRTGPRLRRAQSPACR